MVRTYVRKTDRGKSNSKETLTIAATEVLARRVTLRQASAQNKIPKATLKKPRKRSQKFEKPKLW